MANVTEIVVRVLAGTRHGSEFIKAIPMGVEGADATSPVNLTWSDWADGSMGREFADLDLEAHVSDYDGRGYVWAPAYDGAYRVEARRAEFMAKTLKRVQGVIRKAEAREAGDIFVAFCRAVGAKRVIWSRDEEHCGGWKLSDERWTFDTVAGGRDRFRALIAKAESRVKPKITAA